MLNYIFDHKNSTPSSYPTRRPYRVARHNLISCICIQRLSTQIVFISSQHQILITPKPSQHFT
ncbi:hypothetical protein Hanom_Chr05g00433111 [Helianthus anomalus]